MNKLTDAGLLEKIDDQSGYYVITKMGRSYLIAKLDGQVLRRDE